jgi:hypothetical protein
VIGLVDGIDPSAAKVRTDVQALAVSLRRVPGVVRVATPFDAGLPSDQAGTLIPRTGTACWCGWSWRT